MIKKLDTQTEPTESFLTPSLAIGVVIGVTTDADGVVLAGGEVEDGFWVSLFEWGNLSHALKDALQFATRQSAEQKSKFQRGSNTTDFWHVGFAQSGAVREAWEKLRHFS